MGTRRKKKLESLLVDEIAKDQSYPSALNVSTLPMPRNSV